MVEPDEGTTGEAEAMAQQEEGVATEESERSCGLDSGCGFLLSHELADVFSASGELGCQRGSLGILE